MKKVFSFIICIVFFSIFMACSKSKPVLEAGMYEIKAKTIMKGVPMAMPPVTYTQCLTQEDFVPSSPSDKSNKDCVIKDQKVSGNEVTWKTECKTSSMTSNGSGKIIYNKDKLKGTLEMTTVTNGKEMKFTMEMSGKRIGECN